MEVCGKHAWGRPLFKVQDTGALFLQPWNTVPVRKSVNRSWVPSTHDQRSNLLHPGCAYQRKQEMYSHTDAHCFYLIFGLPLLWHTKMKATKVLLYNKHHRKKKRVNCTFIEEYTAKRATVFFFLMGLNCTQPCSLTLFMSNAKAFITSVLPLLRLQFHLLSRQMK